MAITATPMSLPTPLTVEPNHTVTATCRQCGHAVLLDIPVLVATHVNTPFVEIAKRLRCQSCGDKGALLTVRYDDPRRA
jgi:hypothetical protein